MLWRDCSYRSQNAFILCVLFHLQPRTEPHTYCHAPSHDAPSRDDRRSRSPPPPSAVADSAADGHERDSHDRDDSRDREPEDDRRDVPRAHRGHAHPARYVASALPPVPLCPQVPSCPPRSLSLSLPPCCFPQQQRNSLFESAEKKYSAFCRLVFCTFNDSKCSAASCDRAWQNALSSSRTSSVRAFVQLPTSALILVPRSENYPGVKIQPEIDPGVRISKSARKEKYLTPDLLTTLKK